MKRSVFCKVEHPETSKVSYLLGTMHTSDGHTIDYVKPALSALNKVSHFYSEMDLGNPPSAAEFADVFQFVDTDLKEILGNKKFEKARQIIQKSSGIDIDRLKSYKPFYLNNMVATSYMLNDRPEPMDQWLYKEALSLDLTCSGVETADEQMQTGRNLDSEAQLKAFNDMWRSIGKVRSKVLNLKELYLTGDVQKLYQSSKRGLGVFRKILLYDRNVIMADRIADFTAANACFVAIGAAHLGGDKGVLRLLKKKGCKITPLALS